MSEKPNILGYAPAKISLEKVAVDRLSLDFDNPRITGKSFDSEMGLLEIMYMHYSLDELALSMAQFGYFDAEPVVVVPSNLPKEFDKMEQDELAASKNYKDFISDPATKFIVIEGNRRVSTIKLLLNIHGYRDALSVRKDIFLTELPDAVKSDLSAIPVIVYPHRDDIIPYLGVRHISGNKPWEPYPQALYIANLIEKRKYSFDEVKNLMSDKSGKVIKNYLSLRLLDQAEELGIDTARAKDSFSFLTLSIGQSSIKDYLGLPKNLGETESKEKVIDEEHIDNFKKYFTWIFGDKSSGKLPLITESRDITSFLTKILANDESKAYLEKTGDMSLAYEKSDGERNMVISGLGAANLKLANLRDMLDFLISKGTISYEEIESTVFGLNRSMAEINSILEKNKKNV